MAKKSVIGKIVPVAKAWLSKAEACAYLDCEERFIAALRDENRITFSKIGAKYYYELASIERLLDANKIVAMNTRRAGL